MLQERMINLLNDNDFDVEDIQYLLNILTPEALENEEVFTDEMILHNAKLHINLWKPLYEDLARYVIAHDNLVRIGY